MAWLIFGAASAAIVYAAISLTRDAEEIATRTGVGHVWIGALLVAGVTSLPELASNTVAVVRDSPDLATGSLFGSNMANMAILGGLMLLLPPRRLAEREVLGLVLTAAIAIGLTGLAALFTVARPEGIAGRVSFSTPLLLTVTVGGIFMLRQYRGAEVETIVSESETAKEPRSLRRLWLGVIWPSAVIFAAAPALVWSAEEIADITGLSQSFVGVAGLAVATSLPELASSSAAFRLGAQGLAIGNLFGSNVANMVVLVWLDLLHTDAPLLETAEAANAAAGLVAMLLMTIALTDLVLRSERRRLAVDPVAALIVGGYLVGTLIVWTAGE